MGPSTVPRVIKQSDFNSRQHDRITFHRWFSEKSSFSPGCLYLDAVFVHVDVVLALSASPRLAEEDEVFKQEHLTHHLLPALEHQELVLPQQLTLLLQVHLKTIMIKVFIKSEILSVETILSAYMHTLHTHACTHTHTCMHTHARAKTHTHVCAHTRSHACTHSHTHTQRHPHTWAYWLHKA